MSKNIIFALLWIAVLVFIAWPIALFCAWFWIILQVSCMPWLSALLNTNNNDSLTLLLLASPLTFITAIRIALWFH